MQLADIKKLAILARLDMSEEEMMAMATEFDPILAYVSQVQEVTDGALIEATYLVENVMRDDVATHTPGIFTEKIIAEMPDTQDGYLKVKQIL